jgi:putative transposase
MLRNRFLARAVSDIGFFLFRRQLTYKAAMAGSTLVIAPRWFPSSRRCFVCEAVKRDLSLGDRNWTCTSCGTTHDRELNAAINLARYAESLPAAACGAESITANIASP